VAAVLGADPTTVSRNACKSCHRPHHAEGIPWILHRLNIAATCTSCHDGRTASDIRSQIEKSSNHGMSTQGPPPGEGSPYVEGTRISCADCHNPHAAGSPGGLPPDLPSSLAQVPGVQLNGGTVEAIQAEYELCFRCHGDAPVSVAPVVSRDVVQSNKRLQFQPGNPSYHPVGSQGRNSDVPSLIPPLTTASMITCGDCHGSDDSRKEGGSGPAGPHGSAWRPLLAARYDTGTSVSESSAAYALCYRCHQRDSVLRDESFRGHRKHVVNEDTPCSVCHDPHGIYAGQGTDENHSHLINFDRSVVFPNRDGRIEFIDLGKFRGECNLTCHGKDHRNKRYGGMH